MLDTRKDAERRRMSEHICPLRDDCLDDHCLD